MTQYKVLTVVRTRSEVIKLAPVILQLEHNADHFVSRVFATAQHRQMLDQVLAPFGINPDHDLDIMTDGQSLAQITSRAIERLDRVAAFGAVLYGFGDFYNRFMGAHGKGAVLRNTAIMVGIANAAGFFVFVPLWGAWGTIAVNVLAGVVYPGVTY